MLVIAMLMVSSLGSSRCAVDRAGSPRRQPRPAAPLRLCSSRRMRPATGESLPEPARPFGKTITTRDEQRADQEQPELGEALGEEGLAEVDQQRAVDRADQTECRPPTAAQITISIEGTMPTNDGDMKPTCSVNMAPPMRRQHGRVDEGEGLEVGDVVARRSARGPPCRAWPPAGGRACCCSRRALTRMRPEQQAGVHVVEDELAPSRCGCPSRAAS